MKIVLIINMLYIPKIADYVNILTDEEVNDFLSRRLSVYFKSTKEE